MVAGPIHYDFLLPLTQTTTSVFDFLSVADFPITHPDARWLVIGWGARDFYTTTGTYRDVSAGAIWRGLTGDASVMRVDVAGTLSTSIPVRQISLTADEYDRLLTAIRRSFASDSSGAPVLLPQLGFSSTDLFYQANGQFNLFQTCNVWIGQMLRDAGVRFGWWTPTPYAVTLSHWLFHTR